MPSIFQSKLWQIAVPPPWKAQACDECVEFTQHESAGALHISGALKTVGPISDREALEKLMECCRKGVETERVVCGDFEGFAAAFADDTDGHYWKKWILYCGQVLLFITYNCRRGEKAFEVSQAATLLSSLQCRA